MSPPCFGAAHRADALVRPPAIIATFSAAICLAVVLLAKPVIGFYALEPEVRGMAVSFLTIYGGLSFFMAANLGQANILRAYGYPSASMVINGLSLSRYVFISGTSIGNAGQIKVGYLVGAGEVRSGLPQRLELLRRRLRRLDAHRRRPQSREVSPPRPLHARPDDRRYRRLGPARKLRPRGGA